MYKPKLHGCSLQFITDDDVCLAFARPDNTPYMLYKNQ